MDAAQQQTQGMTMCNLNVGTDQISVKDAIRRVRQNISELQQKLTQTQDTEYFGEKIQRFYERKIATQQATLEWLERAL